MSNDKNRASAPQHSIVASYSKRNNMNTLLPDQDQSILAHARANLSYLKAIKKAKDSNGNLEMRM